MDIDKSAKYQILVQEWLDGKHVEMEKKDCEDVLADIIKDEELLNPTNLIHIALETATLLMEQLMNPEAKTFSIKNVNTPTCDHVYIMLVSLLMANHLNRLDDPGKPAISSVLN